MEQIRISRRDSSPRRRDPSPDLTLRRRRRGPRSAGPPRLRASLASAKKAAGAAAPQGRGPRRPTAGLRGRAPTPPQGRPMRTGRTSPLRPRCCGSFEEPRTSLASRRAPVRRMRLRERRARQVLGRVHRRGPRWHRADERCDHVPCLRLARVRLAAGGGRGVHLKVARGAAVSRAPVGHGVR